MLFWLEVRFPVGAEYGLRVLVCCCVSLDREEGHNWCLFSWRNALLEPGRRRDETRYSLKCYGLFIHLDQCGVIVDSGMLLFVLYL